MASRLHECIGISVDVFYIFYMLYAVYMPGPEAAQGRQAGASARRFWMRNSGLTPSGHSAYHTAVTCGKDVLLNAGMLHKGVDRCSTESRYW